MKRVLFLLSIIGFALQISAQIHAAATDEQALTAVVDQFMASIKTKDSVAFYALFLDGPVNWVGAYKPATQQKRAASNSEIANFKTSDYKTWFRSISIGVPKEEKFQNLKIHTDGTIAIVNFDFSYWAGNKKGLWGMESWGLVKVRNAWKITSVLFSMEQENIVPEPSKR